MPCVDSGPTDSELVKERLDLATRNLCTLLKAVKKHNDFLRRQDLPDNMLLTIPLDVREWDIQHEKEDRARRDREKREQGDRIRRLKEEQRRVAAELAKLERAHDHDD